MGLSYFKATRSENQGAKGVSLVPVMFGSPKSNASVSPIRFIMLYSDNLLPSSTESRYDVNPRQYKKETL